MARKRKKKSEAPGFDEPAAAGQQERQRLTPVDIQQKVFRLAFRGYNERDVDEFLDKITEELAALHEENKRLRERVGDPGGAGDVGAADRQAEAIVRQAREHAARLVEDAEQRAAATGVAGAAAGTGLPTSFLLQERQFLQQMASLVQGHARRLKDEARRTRAAAEAAPAAGSEERPVPSSEPAPGAEGGAAAAAGGAAIGVAGGVAAEPSPPAGPEEPPPPPPPPAPEEATAAWAPVEEGSPPQVERSVEAPEDSTEASDEDDPMVSAWESAFTGESGDRAYADERPRQQEQEGEPSLRELFWGEE